MSWQAIFAAMLPEHILLAGLVGLIVLEIVADHPRGSLGVSIVTVCLAAVAALALNLGGVHADPFPGQYSVLPGMSLAKALVLAFALPVLLFAREERTNLRFYPLLLSSLYGFCLIVSAESFLTLFLGLELMSLPVYVLVLLGIRRPDSAEAALKYLVLGGTATALFLMGVALLYGGAASLSIAAFATALHSPDVMARAAVVLVVTAFFIKAAIVPFHAWAPDAYEGASVPVTAFMATIIKAGVLLAVVRLVGTEPLSRPMIDLLAILPLVSIVWGNLAAMRQTSFRRMIAYSSIAHAGYLFYAFLGDGATRFQGVVFYLVAYGLANLLAFAALPRGGEDIAADRLDNFKGLFRRRPYAALMIGIAMLSLAGIPPFPGFIAKFLIFRNAMAAGYTTYAVLGLVGSYLGIYFYLRVIQFMFMSADEPEMAPGTVRIALAASVLCLVGIAIFALLPGFVLARL
jgi:NADH-quinone oxidoreductase subunit N